MLRYHLQIFSGKENGNYYRIIQYTIVVSIFFSIIPIYNPNIYPIGFRGSYWAYIGIMELEMVYVLGFIWFRV